MAKRCGYILAMTLALLALYRLCWRETGFRPVLSAAGLFFREDVRRVALTFDDGPSPGYTDVLLDGLKERGVRASFFLIGSNIPGNEELVRRMQEEGHLIGNHTYDHVNLEELEEGEACRQIEKTGNLIYEITGTYPTFLRPPFGAWKEGLDCAVTMLPVTWTVDPLDWNTKNADVIVRRVEEAVEDEDIILLHDNYTTSVEAALRIADDLTKQGYEFVTVDELLLVY